MNKIFRIIVFELMAVIALIIIANETQATVSLFEPNNEIMESENVTIVNVVANEVDENITDNVVIRQENKVNTIDNRSSNTSINGITITNSTVSAASGKKTRRKIVKNSNPGLDQNVFRIVLYSVCGLVIVASLAISIAVTIETRKKLQEQNKNTTHNTAKKSNKKKAKTKSKTEAVAKNTTQNTTKKPTEKKSEKAKGEEKKK